MNERSKERIMQLRTMPYEEYLQTPEWQEKRDQTLERDNHRCRLCNGGEHLHVHHRTYARRGDEDLNDLTTLCEDCHADFHARIQHSQQAMMIRTYEKPSLPTGKDRLARDRIQWEQYLIGLLLRQPDLIRHVCVLLTSGDFSSDEAQRIYQVLSSGQPIPADLETFAGEATEFAALKAPKDQVSMVKQAVMAATRLKRASLLQKNTELQELVRAAEFAGDQETRKRLWEQFAEVRQQLSALDTAMYLQG